MTNRKETIAALIAAVNNFLRRMTKNSFLFHETDALFVSTKTAYPKPVY